MYKFSHAVFTAAVALTATTVQAELTAMTDGSMSDVSGQGGVYLSGEFAINKEGGPLWDDPQEVSGFTPGSRPIYDGAGNIIDSEDCDNGVCGLRFAIKLNENSEGWYVIDDLSGGFAFEGLTLRTREAGGVIDYDSWNGSDFDVVEVSDEILEIGLPGTVSFNDFKFKFAVANSGEFGVPLENGTDFRQTEIFGVQINGDITLDGNLLLFPVD